VSVRDNLEEIGDALKFACDACDVVITSGGLGPTHDDMTLEAIALALDVEREEDQEAMKIIERQYKTLHAKGIVQAADMTPSRRKMGVLPVGSKPLNNEVGGAPGVLLEYDDTAIFCLPGVPSELKFIFDDSLVPWVQERITSNYVETIVEFDVNDESVFAPGIDRVMKKYPEVYIKSMPKTYGTTWTLRVWLSARGDDLRHLKEQVSNARKYLEEVTGVKSKPAEM
jgi:molybdenum cofactor synthesis domain-containing protein